MTELDKFINIFEGLNSAYGQTVKTDQFSEKGKHKTKSFTISNPVTKKLWREHLEGKDPALGIVPINKENKCKWGCIDIDTYPFDHKKFILKLKEKNIPIIVCRSKSGGAHAFLFTKESGSSLLGKNKNEICFSGFRSLIEFSAARNAAL